jgi:hypothetical protein
VTLLDSVKGTLLKETLLLWSGFQKILSCENSGHVTAVQGSDSTF